MVIPFTYFTPGYWEFSCSSDYLAEIFGEFWCENFKLQVLPVRNTAQISKINRKKLFFKPDNKISSSSILDLKSLETSFTLSQIFSFPREFHSKQQIYSSKAAEFFALRKPRSILLHQETFASLAGIALSIIENNNFKLLELFKLPADLALLQSKKIVEESKTELEDLSLKLNLPNIKNMKRVTERPEISKPIQFTCGSMRVTSSKLQYSLGQILPPRISIASNRKQQRKYPQLPKIAPSSIPSIKLEQSSSFKIKKVSKNIEGLKNNQRKLNYYQQNQSKIDRKFQELKSKERFWQHLHSLVISENPNLNVDRKSR